MDNCDNCPNGLQCPRCLKVYCSNHLNRKHHSCDKVLSQKATVPNEQLEQLISTKIREFNIWQEPKTQEELKKYVLDSQASDAQYKYVLESRISSIEKLIDHLLSRVDKIDEYTKQVADQVRSLDDNIIKYQQNVQKYQDTIQEYRLSLQTHSNGNSDVMMSLVDKISDLQNRLETQKGVTDGVLKLISEIQIDTQPKNKGSLRTAKTKPRFAK